MDKAENVFTKYAFFAMTPLQVSTKKDLTSIPGYLKEQLNSIAGSLVGGVSGYALAKYFGLFVKKPKLTIPLTALGAAIGAGRSLRATERKAGVQPTGIVKGTARTGAHILGNSVAPVIGGYTADYLVSRGLFGYRPQLPTN